MTSPQEESAGARSPHRADARLSRERILHAAAAMLAGDPRAPMGELAAAAGVSRSTLHRHFRTREALALAVAEERAAAQTGAAERADEAALRGPSPVGLWAAPAGGDRRASGSADAPEPTGPTSLDTAQVLDQVPPHLVADQLVAEARRAAGVPVALYVVDVDGSGLLRLAGDDADLPARIDVPLGLGQEIGPDGLPDLYRHLEGVLPGCLAVPLWLRGRATGLLLSVGTPRASLAEIARHGAPALELADGYTDAFESVRRRRATSPAAEMQLNLLPAASIVRVAGAELAGGLLPSAAVGGDWFDFAENRDGTWLAIADATDEGPVAAGRAAVSLGALRSARRQGLGLEASAGVIDRLVRELGGDASISAVLAHWHAPTSVFAWICAGHAPPLLVTEAGTVEPLHGPDAGALGAERTEGGFRPQHRRLRRGERVVLHSDGVVDRRTEEGERFGVAGIERAAADARGRSAAATARAIQRAVVAASDGPVGDDATVLVLSIS